MAKKGNSADLSENSEWFLFQLPRFAYVSAKVAEDISSVANWDIEKAMKRLRLNWKVELAFCDCE